MCNAIYIGSPFEILDPWPLRIPYSNCSTRQITSFDLDSSSCEEFALCWSDTLIVLILCWFVEGRSLYRSCTLKADFFSTLIVYWYVWCCRDEVPQYDHISAFLRCNPSKPVLLGSFFSWPNLLLSLVWSRRLLQVPGSDVGLIVLRGDKPSFTTALSTWDRAGLSL